ncbi:NADH dehydrogenase subunit L [delta proteobacterium NaphS2]|nr:NADH dehydrogenase subunit L [delta proteobacterium NaphS2]
MFGLLVLVPLIPLVGALLLTAMSSHHPPRKAVAAIGVGSVALSAVIALLITVKFVMSPPPGDVYIQAIWSWIRVADLSVHVAFQLDALSLIWMLIITFVGALIHLYSSEFMADENDWNYARFFSYMNFFVGMMLILVLADNMALLYLGWEGVGLCSYLLIGFWYQDHKNDRAARKAFIVTRIGDTAFLLGIFLLFDNLGTLHIQTLMARATEQWPTGSSLAVLAAVLLLGGAVGKSAQLPLQIWLPDAMAGPTPVSALIHAATMVTAGVYLILRAHVLFLLAPSVMLIIAIVGTLTLVLAGFSGITQWDIKRVLAYSTISQIGYMFLALGVGAWSAAVFHFMVHAFFKALLFLGAGVIIIRLEHEHDMFKMGGLRKELPLTFWTFLLGANALAALPLISAGFYSKDAIIWDAWSSALGGPWLWGAALLGAFLTGIYTFRMVFLTFFGPPQPLVLKHAPIPRPGMRMGIPLVILAVLSVIAGLLGLPEWMGGFQPLADFLHQVVPKVERVSTSMNEGGMGIVSAAIALCGLALAFLMIMRWRGALSRLVRVPVAALLHRIWFVGWGFDWLDNKLIIKPFLWLTRADKNDVVDLAPRLTGRVHMGASSLLQATQTGRLGWYAFALAAGVVLVLTGVIVL